MITGGKRSSAKLGLALSGGGYRAAAFHLGTLHRLHQLGYLQHVEVLSTVSGGSIVGAAYCLHAAEGMEQFYQRLRASLLRDSVKSWVLRSGIFSRLVLFAAAFLGSAVGVLFTRWAPISPLLLGLFAWLLLRYQFRWFPLSQEVEKAYDQFFFHGCTLPDLPATPELAIGSSNLQTGRPFTFTRHWMGDSAYTYNSLPIRFTTAGFPLARAVTASSCVPFAFTPVPIAAQFFHQAADTQRVNPHLIDGGVYDNQGLQKLTQSGSHFACDLLIASDAGGGWAYLATFHNTLTLLLRTVDLFMSRIRNFQLAANLYQHAAGQGRPVAYIALSWRLASCIPRFVDNLARGNVLPQVLQARRLPAEWIAEPARYRSQIEQHLQLEVGYEALAQRDLSEEQWQLACQVGTNLTPLTPDQFDVLVRQAENLTELQVKLYLPNLT